MTTRTNAHGLDDRFFAIAVAVRNSMIEIVPSGTEREALFPN